MAYQCDNTEAHAEAEYPPGAAIVLTELATGTVMAFCDQCWPGYLVALADGIRATLAGAPATAPEPAPAEPDDGDASDAEAIARVEAVGRDRTAAELAAVTPHDDEPEGPAAAGGAGPGGDSEQPAGDPPPVAEPAEPAAAGPTVIRRGTSRSRRAHEARRRQKAKADQGEADQ